MHYHNIKLAMDTKLKNEHALTTSSLQPLGQSYDPDINIEKWSFKCRDKLN